MTSDTPRSRKLVLGFALVGFLLLHVDVCSSAKERYSFIRNATLAPHVFYYDYIIIGGGTAGCPLAATLSRNFTVLLLERGGSPYTDPNITRLSAFGNSISDLSPDSPSQRFVSEDGVVNARARVLGGGSALNAGFYSRASRRYIREVGWEERLVNESYRWVEAKVAFEPELGPWQTAVRDGLLEAGVVPNNGFTYDHVGGTKIGGTIFDRNGLRHTAADLLQYADSRRATVLLHATVYKILFNNKGRAKPKAYGVVFKDSFGRAHKAYLRTGSFNEIIVSAGTLGSPQLLMLSGIGPPDKLRQHNITVVSSHPMVGQNMADNPMNALFIPSPLPVEISLIQVVGITPVGVYIESAGGESFGPKSDQRSASAESEKTSTSFQGGFILEKIIGPKSSGNMELRTPNPDDNPSVRFNYFQDPRDLKRCVEGMQTIQRVIESKAFSNFKFDRMTMQYLLNLTASAPVNLRPRHTGNSISFEQYCKDTVMTIWHYHGGCTVGEVVDEDYRVIGVDRLRVIDTSTFINCPGTNPQATVMMLGRYMGVRILRERSSA